ncbi:hypothetical protein HK104_002442 [Borealophlyctis nickersoniae]|nr:hypothetical protein HK104_002442 [Borealophlyctis nickersoniae]
MDELLDRNRAEAFAAYADKHELFDLFEGIISRMLVERPEDVTQFMIEQLQKRKARAIVICGPPASGLTKICDAISRHFEAIHISTGTLLRQAVEKQTSLGLQAKPHMERGQLVPDQIMLGLVTTRLQDPEVVGRGYVLDGFPRTKEQAYAMQRKGILPDEIVFVDVPDDVIVEYCAGVRIDPVTQREYHLALDPPPRNPVLEARLIQKGSNMESSVRARLEQYRRHLPGVLACFQKTARKISFERGIIGHEEDVVKSLFNVLATRRMTRAPRLFKIFICGKPGSGKTSAAKRIQDKYGYVHVSPRTVILEEISAKSNWGNQLKDYVDHPEDAPEPILLELISSRLKKKDCMDKGWVLEGFPLTRSQALWLSDHDVQPNRLMWLSASEETCYKRLTQRRYDPATGRVVNIANPPADLKQTDFSGWVIRPEDAEENVRRRFERSRLLKSEISQVWAREGKHGHTVFQEIDAEGLGEPDARGDCPTLEKLYERVEGMLLRPAPIEANPAQ